MTDDIYVAVDYETEEWLFTRKGNEEDCVEFEA